MIFVCVFLYRTYNEVRIPCSINLFVKSSTSTIDAKFVEGDLETTGCMYVRFIHTAKSHASFILCQFLWPYLLSWGTAVTVFKVMCYKSEGRWFDSSLCHWNYSLT